MEIKLAKLGVWLTWVWVGEPGHITEPEIAAQQSIRSTSQTTKISSTTFNQPSHETISTRLVLPSLQLQLLAPPPT